jgi:hypothetical protein
MHVATGTTAYRAPVAFGLAWWVPFLFGAAAVAMGLARPLAERITGWTTAPPTGGRAVYGLVLFVLGYVASSVLPLPPPLVAGIIGILFVCAWGIGDGSALGVALALGTAVIGTAVEVGLTSAGAFSHRDHEIAGVAVWLPALYATGQAAVGALGKRFVET